MIRFPFLVSGGAHGHTPGVCASLHRLVARAALDGPSAISSADTRAQPEQIAPLPSSKERGVAAITVKSGTVQRAWHGPGGSQVSDKPRFVGCSRPPSAVIVDAGGSLTAQAVTAEPGRAPLVRVRSGACSRAEAKGGGTPTGMSATAAVVGKPIYTPPRLRRRRPNAVPMPSHANSPPIDAGDNCAVMTALQTVHRTNMRANAVPMPCQPTPA